MSSHRAQFIHPDLWRAPIWFSIILATFYFPLLAQQKPLSPKAQRLSEALLQLMSSPNDSAIQEHYLKLFPQDYKDFLELFDLDRELYDGHEYILALPSLAKNHELEVGRLLIQLSKDAHYEADALSYLQHDTAAYAGEHTKIFASLLGQLSAAKQSQLITFLADVENHAAYKEYQPIIDHLKTLGENELAHKFEIARSERSKRHH
jgi:hypothetical protein